MDTAVMPASTHTLTKTRWAYRHESSTYLSAIFTGAIRMKHFSEIEYWNHTSRVLCDCPTIHSKTRAHVHTEVNACAVNCTSSACFLDKKGSNPQWFCSAYFDTRNSYYTRLSCNQRQRKQHMKGHWLLAILHSFLSTAQAIKRLRGSF